MTQQQLAQKVGLNIRYLSRLENSPQNITLEVLEKIASGLNRSPFEFLTSNDVAVSNQELETLNRALDLLASFKAQLRPKE